MLRTGPVLAGFMLLVAITLVTGKQEPSVTGKQEPTTQSHGGKTPEVGPSSKTEQSPQDYAGGAVFTAWGRSVCPTGASLVYKGYIGGGHVANSGASSEYVCLTNTPTWYRSFPAYNTYSVMHGTEYKAGDGLFNLNNVGDDTIVNHNAVCAVCQSTRPVQVMVPGTMQCMSGWTREYFGYLMSSRLANQLRTNYICVDISPEVVSGGHTSEGGAELWPVEANCGHSLTCPPYKNNEELTCAVCSK